MRKNEEEQGRILLRCGKSVILGGGVGATVCLLLLLLAAIGISSGFFSMKLQYQLAVVGCVLGSFAGGAWAVRQCSAQRMLVGLAVGGVLFLLQLTAGLLLFETAAFENGGIGLLFGDLCGGAAAALVTKEKRRKNKKGKKRKGH